MPGRQIPDARAGRRADAAAIAHDDVYTDEVAVIEKCRFGKFGDAPELNDGLPEQFQNAPEMYKALHEEMKKLQCTRCNMKGHTRAACWYGNQLNLTARKLGGRFKKNYAAVRRRFGAMRKRIGKAVVDADNRNAKENADKVTLGVLGELFPEEAGQLNAPIFQEDPAANQG